MFEFRFTPLSDGKDMHLSHIRECLDRAEARVAAGDIACKLFNACPHSMASITCRVNAVGSKSYLADEVDANGFVIS